MSTKVVIFDFDGTLTKSRKESNSWREIWKEIDDLETDDKYIDMYKKGEITDRQWINMIVARYKEKGVTGKTFRAVADRIQLLPGVDVTFKVLQELGIKLFVLSGGVRNVIEDVLRREDAWHYLTAADGYDLILNREGKLFSYAYPECNPENKNEFVERVMNFYKLKPEEVLFVGNANNDESVHKTGVETLCINPYKTDIKNKTIWTHGLEVCENLLDILQFVKFPSCTAEKNELS